MQALSMRKKHMILLHKVQPKTNQNVKLFTVSPLKHKQMISSVWMMQQRLGLAGAAT
jgi:hypothetical protein